MEHETFIQQLHGEISDIPISQGSRDTEVRNSIRIWEQRLKQAPHSAVTDSGCH